MPGLGDKFKQLVGERLRCSYCDSVTLSLGEPYCSSCGGPNEHFSFESMMDEGHSSVESAQDHLCSAYHTVVGTSEGEIVERLCEVLEFPYCPFCGRDILKLNGINLRIN